MNTYILFKDKEILFTSSNPEMILSYIHKLGLQNKDTLYLEVWRNDKCISKKYGDNIIEELDKEIK